MNPEEFIRMMQGGGNNNSVLKRNPTTNELDEFINRVMERHDMNPQMLYLDLQNKLEPQGNSVVMLSFEEAEIYPMVMIVWLRDLEVSDEWESGFYIRETGKKW